MEEEEGESSPCGGGSPEDAGRARAPLAPGSRQTGRPAPGLWGGLGGPWLVGGGQGGLLEASCAVSLAWEDHPCQTQSPQDSCDPIALSCPKDVKFYRAYLASGCQML